MNATELLKNHRIPCGPMAVNAEGNCRRRLRDHYDLLLDRLTHETHPSGVDEEILAMDEQVDIPEEPEPKEPEETDEEKKERLIKEGKLKADVKKEVQKYEEKLFGNSKMLQNQSGKIQKR